MGNFKARTFEIPNILSVTLPVSGLSSQTAPSTGAADGSIVINLYDGPGCSYSGSLAVTNTSGAVASKAFASTDVNTTTDAIAITAHGFVTGQAVTLTTSGTLPAPTVVLTTYYIINNGTNSIKLATTQALAVAGTALDLTTAGAGNSNVVPASASYSVFVDASNDNVSYVPYYSYESMTVATTWQWLLEPEYKFYRLRKVVAGGVIGCKADLLILGIAD